MTATNVHTHTSATSAGFTTRWQCGRRSGTVSMPDDSSAFAKLRAELIALGHLAVQARLVGHDAGTTPPVFTVSDDLVPRAVQSPHEFPTDVRLASRSIRARFSDASFEVSTAQPERLPGANDSRLPSLTPENWTVHLGGVGHVILTEHAVARLQQRFNFATRGLAFRQLYRWSKRTMHEVELPPGVLAEKLLRYGPTTRTLRDDTGWHGVVVDGTLVTMFHRN